MKAIATSILYSVIFLVIMYALTESLEVSLLDASGYMVMGVVGIFVINLTEGKR